MIKGSHHTPEAKAKNAASHVGVPYKTPRPQPPRTPEARVRQSAAQIGRVFSLETKAKISAALTGKKKSAVACKRMSEAKKGRRLSEETKAKLSNIFKGRLISDEQRVKMSIACRGRHISMEQRVKISAALCGKNSPRWRGGISFEPYCEKFNNDMRRRIRAFFDNRCLVCGASAEENTKALSCHHVEYNKQACCDGKPAHFAALCKRCHGKTNHETDRWESMLHAIIDEMYDGRSYFTREEWILICKEK